MKRIVELSTSSIEEMLNKCILPEYKDITYKTIESKSSKSVYIILYYHNVSIGLRFSDHETNKAIRCIYVGKKTSRKTIVNQIKNFIKGLYLKNTTYLLNHKEDE